MKKISGSLVLILIGIIFILSAIGNYSQGISNFSFQSGVVLIFGGLAYLARKKQIIGGSKNWLILETISAIVILLHVFLGLFQNRWYEYPLSFVLIPLIIFGFWLFIFSRSGRLGK